MKYRESTFDEYVQSVQLSNYHPEIKRPMVTSIAAFPHTIYYGPKGVGKYSQMLANVASLSPSQLKYQKKMTVETEKGNYSFSFSDVHYEINMGLLGCNAKIIWDSFFQHIVDMVSVKTEKSGIIVCKNLHQIHTELLDIFFLYFKQYQQGQNILFNKNNIVLKYIFLTEHLSFIPPSLMESCTLVSVARPSKQVLFMGTPSHIREKAVHLEMDNLVNLKNLPLMVDQVDLFENVCQPLLNILLDTKTTSVESIDILKVREYLYNISIYQLDFIECLWYLIEKSMPVMNPDSLGPLLQEISGFLKYYNNNYRTIYHFEKFFFTLRGTCGSPQAPLPR